MRLCITLSSKIGIGCAIAIKLDNGLSKVGRVAISNACGINIDQYLEICFKHNAVIHQYNGVLFENFNDAQRCIKELEPYLILNQLIGE